MEHRVFASEQEALAHKPDPRQPPFPKGTLLRFKGRSASHWLVEDYQGVALAPGRLYRVAEVEPPYEPFLAYAPEYPGFVWVTPDGESLLHLRREDGGLEGVRITPDTAHEWEAVPDTAGTEELVVAEGVGPEEGYVLVQSPDGGWLGRDFPPDFRQRYPMVQDDKTYWLRRKEAAR